MPTPKRGSRLGGGPAHQKLMLAGLASDLFRHGRVRTTLAKAKELRPYAERLITKAKQGDLHARRQVLAKLRDRDVVAYLFEDVAPRFADRPGGYTRIYKLEPRKGDNAPMALIELVELGDQAGDDVIEDAKQGRMRGLFGRRRRRDAAEAGAGIGAGAGAATALAELADVDDESSADDDEVTDEQVAAAVAAATGGAPAASDSDDSDDSADSDDSDDSADSGDERA